MKANLLRAVRSALARTSPISGHPDANLLAAFAENTLLARERAEIAGHLADCAECREFLALAFGAMEADSAVVAQPRAARKRSPVWNWAASAAAICIVVSAVWEFGAQRVPQIEPPPRPPTMTAPGLPNPAPAEAARAVHARRTPPATTVAQGEAPAPSAAPPPPSRPLPPPSPKKQTEPADAVSMARQQQAQAFQAGDQAAVQAAPQNYVQEEKAGAAAARVRSAPGVAMKTARGAVSGFAAMARPAPALWTIASGTVQRSDDGGATWRTVAIDDRISFSAVVNAGSDVWAGGSAGALFHSADFGAHWQPIVLDATGTITQIWASSSGEVWVTTDTHERWSSLDDGRNWRLTVSEDTPR